MVVRKICIRCNQLKQNFEIDDSITSSKNIKKFGPTLGVCKVCAEKEEDVQQDLTEEKVIIKLESVQQIDPKTNEIVDTFKSITLAAAKFNKGPANIRRVINKENKTAYGFYWKK